MNFTGILPEEAEEMKFDYTELELPALLMQYFNQIIGINLENVKEIPELTAAVPEELKTAFAPLENIIKSFAENKALIMDTFDTYGPSINIITQIENFVSSRLSRITSCEDVSSEAAHEIEILSDTYVDILTMHLNSVVEGRVIFDEIMAKFDATCNIDREALIGPVEEIVTAAFNHVLAKEGISKALVDQAVHTLNRRPMELIGQFRSEINNIENSLERIYAELTESIGKLVIIDGNIGEFADSINPAPKSQQADTEATEIAAE